MQKLLCIWILVVVFSCKKEDNPEPNPLLQKWKPKTTNGVLRGTTDVSTEFTNFRIHFTSATNYMLTKKDGANSIGNWTQTGSLINLTPDGILTNVQVTNSTLKFEQTEISPKTGTVNLQFELIPE